MKRLIGLGVVVLFVLSMAAVAMAQAATPPAKAPTSFDKAQAPGTKATCIVTGKELTIEKETPFSVYKEKYYYFADAASKAAFDKEPTKYVK